MPKVLAVDYGKKRVGLAISDEAGTFAFPLTTLEGLNSQALQEALAALLPSKGVGHIVVGLPRNMDGSLGFMAEAIEAFCERLRLTLASTPSLAHISLSLLDERLTSKLAEQSLRAVGKAPSRHKALIDQEAARNLLETYLRQQRGLH
jgi:putative Holliday junction resolvase